jgi:hypothetical protein
MSATACCCYPPARKVWWGCKRAPPSYLVRKLLTSAKSDKDVRVHCKEGGAVHWQLVCSSIVSGHSANRIPVSEHRILPV